MKAKTLTYYKKRAWASFSKYIRLKYADKQGMENCYTCLNPKHWKEMQAGHGIGGRNNAVLFLEEVVRPQCAGCNLFGGGKYAIFTRRLIDELGLDKYDELVTLSNQVVQYKVADYQEKERYYAEKTKEYEL